MRQWKRLGAILLAAVVAANELSLAPFALAANEATVSAADAASAPVLPTDSSIRFVQTPVYDENGTLLNDGFDEATGILNMSLQIKRPAVVDDTVNIRKQAISEGFFVFQTDASEVIPVTNPSGGAQRQEILPGGRATTAVVASTSSSSSAAMREYLDDSKTELIYSSFIEGMSANADGRSMDPDLSGMLVSNARVNNWTDESGTEHPGTGMLDCYVQFSYNWGNWQEGERETVDGYVSVINLQFQCYAGYNENGRPKPAESADTLFASSVRLPENDTAAQEIVNQFYYEKDGRKVPMAMGAAGVVQKYKYRRLDGSGGNTDKESVAYYYYGLPQITDWRIGSTSRAAWNGVATVAPQMTGTPDLWYEYMDKKYVMEGFSATVNNTFSTDLIPDPSNPDQLIPMPDPDFTVPELQRGDYPRYEVPDWTQATANEQAGQWVPIAYGDTKPVNLKYYMASDVSSKSLSSPELEMGLEEFAKKVKWEFLLEDGTPLEVSRDGTVNCQLTETDAPAKLLKTSAGNTPSGQAFSYYRVKEAAITDSRYGSADSPEGNDRLYGQKVWKVYYAIDPADPSRDEYYMTGPVGVILDMLPTEITYRGMNGERLTGTALAPQLHVTSDAADSQNYIWASLAPGQLYYRAVYDPEGLSMTDLPVTIRLYKEDSAPKYVDLEREGIPTDADSGKATFWVGNTELDGSGTETGEDVLMTGTGKDVVNGELITSGLVVRSTLYDQYHLPYTDRFSSLEITRDGGGASQVDNAFTVEQVVQGNESGWIYTNAYTIKYKDGMTVNEAVRGDYTLTVSYGPGVEPVTLPICINKSDDRLGYLSTSLTLPHSITTLGENLTETLEDGSTAVGNKYEVSYRVPSETSTGVIQERAETISILELANQWRTPGIDPSKYDILPGLRTKGSLDIEKMRGIVSFQVSYPESAPNGYPASINTENISKGKFTFNSHVPRGAEFTCRVTAKYGGQTRFVEYQFKFTYDERVLQSVRINQPKTQSEYIVKVPTLAEEAGGKVEPVLLEVVPFDQYGSQWDWDQVERAYSPGGSANPSGEPYEDWDTYSVEEELPTGVYLEGSNNATIRADHTAQDGTFRVYAKFMGMSSNRVTVRVQREPRRPDLFDSLSYASGTNTIVPIGESGTDIVSSPTMVIYDQYSEALTDYEQKWTATVTAVNPADQALAVERVKVDLATGAISVHKSAPTCKVSLRVRVTKNGASQSKAVTVNITRNTEMPTSISVTNKTIQYPDQAGNGSALTQLTATGSTQYGSGHTFTQSDLTWKLYSVEFPDATLTDADISRANNEYTARSVTLTDSGILRFGSVSQAQNIPTKVWVVVRVNGGMESDPHAITIAKNASVPTSILIPWENYQDGIQVPAYGAGAATLSLDAYVRDQYGVLMRDADIKWSIDPSNPPEGAGLTVDTDNKLVTVTYQAEQSDFTVIAVCGNLPAKSQTIQVWKDASPEVSYIEVTGMKGAATVTPKSPASMAEMEIALPAKVGNGYAEYTMDWVVLNQFRNQMNSPVEWSVVNADGSPVSSRANGDPDSVRAEITDASSGYLRVYFDEDAYSRGNGTLYLKAASTVAGYTNIYGMAKITVVKDSEQVPSYAVPQITDYGAGSVVEGGIQKPSVPGKDLDEVKIKVGVTVYDQYGKEIAGAPADLKMEQITGLTQPKPTGVDNEWELTLQPVFLGSQFSLIATPKGKPQSLVAGLSDQTFQVKKGTAFANELVLDDGNDYRPDVPTWNSTVTDYVGSEDNVEQITLKAWVLDQFTAWLKDNSDITYPVWEFVGDHTGVTFAVADQSDGTPRVNKDGTRVDPNGPVQGEEILLDISNRANGKVQIKVSTQGEEGAAFEKIVTLDLQREPRRIPTYLYINGSDASGFALEDLERPYADKGVAVYQFLPEVFDQYGTKIEDAEIDIDLITSRLPSGQGLRLEKVFEPGKKEDDEDQPRPIGYEIYLIEYPDGVEEGDEDAEEKAEKTLLAEFDRITGELKVYTACNTDILDSLAFEATALADSITAGKRKVLVLNLTQQDLSPYAVRLVRQYESYPVNGSDEDILDFVTPVVYSQYGAKYDGRVQIAWSLHVRDEDGKLTDYNTELDEDGNPRPPSDFLVLLDASDPNVGAGITIQSESYFEDKTVVLRCRVLDSANPDITKAVYNYADLTVFQPRGSGGGAVAVTFDAGEYGKLVGPGQFFLGGGEVPPSVPGVKSVTGYGMIGWTADGETLVDPALTPVYADVVYVAVYRDVRNTRFLDGYGGNLIKPEGKVTRAEFVKMLVSALGGYDPKKNYGRSFRDIGAGDWYANYIAFAKQKGIADGYPDGTFRPNDTITRAEACKLLDEAIQLPVGESPPFSDVSADAWYEKHVGALYDMDVIDGYSDGTFRPGKKITRAEAVKILIMITENAPSEFQIRNIQENAYCPFIDVKRGHWAYAYILRAAGIA